MDREEDDENDPYLQLGMVGMPPLFIFVIGFIVSFWLGHIEAAERFLHLQIGGLCLFVLVFLVIVYHDKRKL